MCVYICREIILPPPSVVRRKGITDSLFCQFLGFSVISVVCYKDACLSCLEM